MHADKILKLTVLLLIVSITSGPYYAQSVATELRSDQRLTLQDCISLALQNNRDLINARWNREVQKLSYRVAKDKFVPDLAFGVFADEEVRNRMTNQPIESAGFTSRVTLNVPFGGALSMNWDNRLINNDQESGQLTLRFTQPLLRGAGWGVSTASVKIAGLREENSILTLKNTLMSTVVSVVFAYRNLLLAEMRTENAELSLKRARELLATNNLLIQAGRMAQQDLLQTEASVASREIDVLRAQNNADRARFALLDILDIPLDTPLPLDPSITITPREYFFETSLEKAFLKRPDYLRTMNNLEVVETQHMVARNNNFWDLDLTISSDYDDAYGSLPLLEGQDESRLQIGLRLTAPFGDLTRREQLLSAKVALLRAKNDLTEIKQQIEVEITNEIRSVEVLSEQLNLARRALQLSQRAYDVEQEKLKRGLSSNFQITRVGDDLLRAQDNEIELSIALLNAITVLDRGLGETLEIWNIELDHQSDPNLPHLNPALE